MSSEEQGREEIRASRSSHFPADINKRFFGALQVFPGERIFHGLEEDEQVVLAIRRHWFTLLPSLAGGIFVILLPIALIGGLVVFPVPSLYIRYGVVVAWFLVAFVVYYFMSVFVAHETNVYLVTNERVLDLDANTIATKSVREIDLGSIDGVEHVSGGGLFFGGLNQGIVTVHTLGGTMLEMRNTPMPDQVAVVISELMEEARLRRPRRRAGESSAASQII